MWLTEWKERSALNSSRRTGSHWKAIEELTVWTVWINSLENQVQKIHRPRDSRKPRITATILSWEGSIKMHQTPVLMSLPLLPLGLMAIITEMASKPAWLCVSLQRQSPRRKQPAGGLRPHTYAQALRIKQSKNLAVQLTKPGYSAHKTQIRFWAAQKWTNKQKGKFPIYS